MPALNVQADGAPGGDEVRAALGQMAASDAFRGSPQLVAFLRYVVEATLRGEADRLKGYTIAVEALGRTDDFDPQIDPIVRVEATRLRRAITRYYANGGKHDPVLIDLPLGSYVPVFRRGALPPVPAALSTPQPARRRGYFTRRANWRHIAAGTALMLLGASAYGGLDLWFDFNTPTPHAASFSLAASSDGASPAWRGSPAYPVVFVGPFRSVSRNGLVKPPAEMLRGKLRDALARFDEVQVVSGTLPGDTAGRASNSESAAPGHYGLTASVESEDAGMISLRVRLTDAADGRVAYAHVFNRLPRDTDVLAGEDAIIREVSAALAQPYGIIQAHERRRAFAAAGAETEYRCLIDAYDYWRSYDPQQHRLARDCLERIIETAPGFSLGYAALAPIVLEEYRGVNPRSGDPPPLTRALQAARRAVELKPASARAHQALANVQFARGDYPLALETGERAVALNPYDPNILADYGGMLVAIGEQERGARLIRQAATAIVVRPVRHDFLLFLTAYLADDHAGAARHAALIASNTYPLGLVAHALVAAQRGETELARQQLDRLFAIRPAWRNDCRGELKKYFPAEAIVDRFARDLDRIGYVPGQ